MKAKELACNYKHEYITPEHILLVMCDVSVFCEAFEACNGDIQVLKTNLEDIGRKPRKERRYRTNRKF